MEELYNERHRPRFHFTARQWTTHQLEPGMREEGWLNDLNGLVHHEGEFHLFAQRWNRCWIHAVSTDLVHWTELEPAFWEESPGSGVQSGTVVIDHDNTSGLSPDGTPAMVAFWSRNDNLSQCVSYSLDRGRTWQHYAGNPILTVPERDPMVFRHAPTDRWVMMLYGNDSYHVLTSTDLLHWNDERQSIPDSYECPDFFELPLDGDAADPRWVLIRGDGRYSVGAFDGTAFVEETEQLESDSGPHFYATQSWRDQSNGRRVQAAWMRGGTYPGMPFNQQVTFPRELSLRTTPDGPRLFRRPIAELAALYEKTHTWSGLRLAPGESWRLPAGELFHVELTAGAGLGLSLDVRGTTVALAGLDSAEALIDRTSIEGVGNGGATSSSHCYLPENDTIALVAGEEAVTVDRLLVHELRSIWPYPAGANGA